jgi:TolB-like protein
MKQALKPRAPQACPSLPAGGLPPAVDEIALRAGLARVERHPALAASPRLRRLLRYLFEETLAGRGAEISQFSIAFDCYQLGKAFDPATNTLIRSHARRLRKLLKELARPDDAGALLMEERGYRLCFGAPAARPGAEPVSAPADPRMSLPSLGVTCFDARPASADGSSVARVLVEEILMALQGDDLVTGLGPFESAGPRSCARWARELARQEQLDFLLEGRIDEQEGQLVIGIRILEGKSGQPVWTTRGVPGGGDASGAGLSAWAATLVSQVGTAWGVIPGQLGAAALARPSGELTPYEAVVLARRYLTHFDFEPLGRIVGTLRAAARGSREAAVAATLAVLLSIVGGVEPRWRESLDKSEVRQLAAHAARLDPEAPWTRLALAFSAMLDGRRAELLEMGRRAAREPHTPVMLVGALGTQLCNQALDLELAREMIARYRHQTPAYPRLVHLALALAALSEGDTRGAREELANFGVPWGWASPLIHAACAALDGDAPQARREWQRVLEAFPEFPARWRETVATQWHESHLTAIFRALEKAGIRID